MSLGYGGFSIFYIGLCIGKCSSKLGVFLKRSVDDWGGGCYTGIRAYTTVEYPEVCRAYKVVLVSLSVFIERRVMEVIASM